MVTKRLWLAGLPMLLAACKEAMAPTLPPCTSSGAPVNLATPGDYVTIDPGPISGCYVFAKNGSGSVVEYLLVSQSSSGTASDASPHSTARRPSTGSPVSSSRFERSRPSR